MKAYGPLLTVMMLVVLSACAESRHDSVSSELSGAQGIMGAQLVDLKQDPLARVVILLEQYWDQDAAPRECTATLVGDQLLITAAHCVDGAEKKKLTPFPRPTHALSDKEYFAFLDYIYSHAPVFRARAKGDTSLLLDVVEVAIHPGYKSIKTSGVENDMALVRLASPVISAGALLKLKLDFEGKPAVGTSVVSYGYGKNKKTVFKGHLDLSGDQSLRRKEFNVIPTPKVLTEEKIDVSDSISFGSKPGDVAGGVCSGDSGGPLFVMKNGEYAIAGVLSRADGGCQLYGVSTSVSDYREWIQKQVAAWKLKLY